MDKATLVETDFAMGSRMLEILDQAGVRVDVALWLRVPDYEDWRFALASRELDHAERSAGYGMLHDALDQGGFMLENTPSLLIFRTSDPFIRALRRIFKGVKSVEGTRLGGQTIGGRFIEDGVVYRIR
jgi:hypothetical protein